MRRSQKDGARSSCGGAAPDGMRESTGLRLSRREFLQWTAGAGAMATMKRKRYQILPGYLQ